MMPEMDGYELTRTLREHGYNMPILMVTAKESFQDKKNGVLLGTDDYMVKPVNWDEMILRIGALLRRASIVNERKLTCGGTTLDLASLTAIHGDNVMVLPLKEFNLLYKLIANQNKIFTRQQLMDEIWGLDSESDERTVDVHINHLRERFKNYSDFEIITVRDLGYKAVRQIRFPVTLQLALFKPPLFLFMLLSIVLAMALSFWAGRHFFGPVAVMSRAMTQVAKGDFDVQMKYKGKVGELAEMCSNFNSMAQELGHIGSSSLRKTERSPLR